MNKINSLLDGGYIALLGLTGMMASVLLALMDTALHRTLRKIDSVTADQPETAEALRRQVDQTPGRLLKLLVARALLKSYRVPRSERVARACIAFGAAVIGGPQGDDYKRQFLDDLNDAREDGKIPAVLVINAFSSCLGSFQMRWEMKIDPFLRARFVKQYAIGAAFLDAAARSAPTAVLVIGGPVIFVVTAIGYLLGGTAVAYGALVAVVFPVPMLVIGWQRGRLRAVKAKRAAKAQDLPG
jgi:hypothetical protein